MAIHFGNLLVFADANLIKDIFAEPVVTVPDETTGIDYGICNYVWVDSPLYEWIDEPDVAFGACSASSVVIVNQVWKDDSYIYFVTSSGLDIFSTYSTNKVSYITNDGGFTTIWGNDSNIYLGTYGYGIKYIEKTTISGGDSEDILLDYDYHYKSGSDIIKYLHGYANTLAVVTDVGIDILNSDSQGFKSTTSGVNFTKCFMTSKNELYYVIQDTDSNSLCKMNGVKCDWQSPDVSYVTGISFLPEDQSINDIFITENTSFTGKDNTVFVATSEGAYILDEGTTEFDIYYSKVE